MSRRLIWIVGVLLWIGVGVARADSDSEPGSGSDVGSGSAIEHHDEHHDDDSAAAPAAPAAVTEPMPTGLEPETEQQMEDSGVDPEEEAEEEAEAKANGEPPFNEFDEDGDGVVSPEERADEAELEKEFAGIPAHIDTEKTDAELDERLKSGKALLPSITVEHFRAGVRAVKKIVLVRMEAKMAAKQDQKMKWFTWAVFVFSCLGVLLLGVPLVLAKKYPGQGAVLFKYSALAAVTFFVTVNLFGGVLFVLRSVQHELSSYTNPTVAIASSTFDTLDHNAPEYAIMGKELFMPTIEALRGNTDEQPATLILQNGQKVVKDAMVFVSIAKMFKKISFVFSVLPIVLLLVTMVLFVLAIRPTLTEIIKLPAMAAQGGQGVGRDVVGRSLGRVRGEMLATLCTIGVLAVLTVVSGLVLGEVVEPVIDSLIRYFSLCITYLQFADGASSGTVFMTLFAVIFFLVLNLGVLILSMSFFLGKCQKIFQARFNSGMPLANHKPFFKWAIPAVLLVQVFPWLFAQIADWIIGALDDGARDGVTDPNAISWGKTLLAGPVILVVGFLVLFWAARGFKAIAFLFKYKVKIPARNSPVTT